MPISAKTLSRPNAAMTAEVGCDPEDQSDGEDAERPVARRRFAVERVVGDQRRCALSVTGRSWAVVGGRSMSAGRIRPTSAPDDPGGEDDDRERHGEHRERDERRDRQHRPACGVYRARALSRTTAWATIAMHRGGDTGEDRGDDRGVAPAGVDDRQRRGSPRSPGSTNRMPAMSPPSGAVEEPAEVDRQLLGLGAGQQGAVAERVQEALLADPSAPVDDLGVHHRDLSGGAAEGLQRHQEPRLRCHPQRTSSTGDWSLTFVPQTRGAPYDQSRYVADDGRPRSSRCSALTGPTGRNGGAVHLLEICVRHTARVSSMVRQPQGALTGWVVGVTADRRHEEQIELLRRRGARVMHAPTLRTRPLGPDDELGEAIEAVIEQRPDVIVLSTGIGVRGWLEAAEALGRADELPRRDR